MKETVKAGISGYVFTFDTDAYEALNTYLDNLKTYFQNKDDGQEIIGDIEARMSELLQLKAQSSNEIITLSDAHDIMGIMGNPSDFVDNEAESASNNQTVNNKKETTPFAKKMYRDTDHSVLGGVCSGLGQYFRFDPVIIRVIYVLSVISIHNISSKLSGMIFMSYIVLWIVMPKAKTIVQKIAMTGQDPSIEAIETGNLKYKEMRGSNLGRILGKVVKIFFGIVLYAVVISIVVSALFALFFPFLMDFPSIKDLLEVNGLYSTDAIISLSMIWLMPAFIILYFVIRLMIKITARDLIILGVAFAVWLGACSYMSIIGVKFAKDYKNEASYIQKIIPNIQSDTIYLQLDDSYRYAETFFDNNELFMIEGSSKSWFFSPCIEIKKDSIYKKIEIEIKKTAFAKDRKTATDKAKNANLEIRERASSLIIKPHLYSKDNLWNREVFSITIYCPVNKEVIVDEPLCGRVDRDTSWNESREEFEIEDHIAESDTTKIP